MDISEQPQLPNDNDDVQVQLGEFCLPTRASFDEWTSLIAKTEKNSPDDIEKVSLLYDSFLSEFPLCYGYWRKYAGHKARLCSVEKVFELYECAIQSATYSIDLWVDYCSFGMLLFEDPMNVRRLFERGMSFVGKDYLCNRLWDKYIEFEYSQKNWSSLAHIYVRTLKYPTKKLRSYYDSFKKLTTILEDEIKLQSNDAVEVQSDATPNGEVAHETVYDVADVTSVIKDLLDPAVGMGRLNALQKYLSIGEQFYQEASDMDAKICVFENRIRRSYFHVKPLDVIQLDNWHQYLDFIEMHGDFDWTVKLHERCLIPCANYPEFWMRYTEFMETKGGREIANLALVRATQIFLKRVPAIHIFCARFKEKIGDVVGSRVAYRQCKSESDSDIIENVQREANMENRLGNSEAAFGIYEEALQVAIEKQNSHIFSLLSVQFSRYKFMVTGNVDATRDVLIKGIQHRPHCKLLIQEILNFEMGHKGLKQMNIVDSIVKEAICPGEELSQGLSNKDREDISILYLEFLDRCGTIHDVMKAWNRHRKLFPHSMRPTLYDNTAGRQDMAIILPHDVSGDEKPHGSIQELQFDQESPPLENPKFQSDNSPTSQSQLKGTCSMEERVQPLASPNDAEQSGQGIDKQNVEAHNMVDEVPTPCQALLTVQEHPEGETKVQEKSDHDCNDDLRPPSLTGLSLSPQNDQTQNSKPTTSHDCETLQAIPISNVSSQHNGDYTKDDSSLSNPTYKNDESQGQVQSDFGLPHVPKEPSFLEVHQRPQPVLAAGSTVNCSVTKVLTDAHTAVPVPHDNQHYWHVQSSQQPQYQSSSMHQQAFSTQNFPSHPQPWQNTPSQPINQAQNQYQVAASQVQPISAYQWPAQNMPQQYFAPAPQLQPQPQPQSQSQPQPQPIPGSGLYAQPQAYQYPAQGNVQFVQMQGSQEFTPQMWHYYIQQQHQQQQYSMLQTQTWNANYYQQQPLVQHYGASQYGQQVVISQGQGTTQQNIEVSGASMTPCPQQVPPSNQ